jgi:hypothetical protein
MQHFVCILYGRCKIKTEIPPQKTYTLPLTTKLNQTNKIDTRPVILRRITRSKVTCGEQSAPQ